MAAAPQRKGLASLAQQDDNEEFSIITVIGGPRGVVESMLPGLLFMIMFVITHDLKLTIIVSAVLAVVQVLVRLIQRQSVWGALGGLLAVGICLIWAWKTGEARNYYVYGFITNAVCIVALLISMLVKIPGLGFLVEFIRTLPTEHYRAWLKSWRSDAKLYKAYSIITWLWIGVFALRLLVQLPLYFTNQVGWLGTTRLLMGLPFWALAIWVSYLIIATPLHDHRVAEREAAAAQDNHEQGEGK